jgi:hypothetical protein
MTITSSTIKTGSIVSCKRERRMARVANIATSSPTTDKARSVRVPSKLDRAAAMLCEADGASIAEIMAAIGWQQHSVRGAMAGALKKRGIIVTSVKVDGVRRYHVSAPA